MDSLYFIAIVPPDPNRSRIEKIKIEFSRKYSVVHALKSPPHITLIPPFRADIKKLDDICKSLELIASQESPFELTAFRFRAFVPRVIYIDFRKSNDLNALHESLITMSAVFLKQHRFTPHMTIAFRDLSPSLFRKAWKEYERKEIKFSFIADRICLLKHDGKRWQILKEFQFAS